MATVYSLGSNAPAGLTINPVNAEVSDDGSGVLPEGTHVFDVISTDTETGDSGVCDTLTIICEQVDGGTGCPEAVLTLLNDIVGDIAEVRKSEIQECVNTVFNDRAPHEEFKELCQKDIIRISYCGRSWDLRDSDGDGIRHLNLTPRKHAYTGDQPDPEAAIVEPTFDANNRLLPPLPTTVIAGPPGVNGGLEGITHFSDGKTWIPVLGSGSFNGPTQACEVIPAEALTFPMVWNTDETTWQVGSETVNVGFCAPRLIDGCMSFARAGVIPNLSVNSEPVVDQGDLETTFFERLGCESTLFSLSPAIPTFASVEFDNWSSNGGTLDVSVVDQITLTFTVSGVSPQVGAGVHDLGTDDFMAITSANGAGFTQNAGHIVVTSPGTYTIVTGVDSDISSVVSDLEGAFWNIEGDTVISNISMAATTGVNQPCGSALNAEELAFVLQTSDPQGNEFFVAPDGSIFVNAPAGTCSIYSQPIFTSSSTVEFCVLENVSFPITYHPLEDGWLRQGNLTLFGGDGFWQTAQELADWFTANDSNGYIYGSRLNPSGTGFDICAQARPSTLDQYQAVTYNGADSFVCVAENVTFPLNYQAGDGWLVNGQFVRFPAGQTAWADGNQLAAWLTANDGLAFGTTSWNNVVNELGGVDICALLPESVAGNYSDLYIGGVFCCQAEGLIFPLTYNTTNDGWIINNEVVQFGGNGVISTAQELVNIMSSLDPFGNPWEAHEFGGTWSICSEVAPNGCNNYGGLVLTEAPTEYCDFENLAFPYTYSPGFTGWGFSDGTFVPFPDDGVFVTPQEFLNFLNGSADALGNAWFSRNSLTGSGLDFCTIIPGSQHQFYLGETQPDFICQTFVNASDVSFPYTPGTGAGWRRNNDTLTFYETDPGGTFTTGEAMADWFTENDDNGLIWFYNGQNAQNAPQFCAIADPVLHSQYQGIFGGDLVCITPVISFPLEYSVVTGGWTIDGIFHPFPDQNLNPDPDPDGDPATDDGDPTTSEFTNLIDLLDWLHSTDPYPWVWVAEGSRICSRKPNSNFGGGNHGALQGLV